MLSVSPPDNGYFRVLPSAFSGNVPNHNTAGVQYIGRVHSQRRGGGEQQARDTRADQRAGKVGLTNGRDVLRRFVPDIERRKGQAVCFTRRGTVFVICFLCWLWRGNRILVSLKAVSGLCPIFSLEQPPHGRYLIRVLYWARTI